ncbi:MAG: ISL3 family transposase [Roseiflexaceae bacterium]|nr:ISL3 family transposase [Roseiflexaceae bacterium]
MAKGVSITIPLDIPEVRILRVGQTSDGEYLIAVESTRTTTACRRCGCLLTEAAGHDAARRVRHLAILGRPVYIEIRPKRFRCPHCPGQPSTTQRLDWYDPEALHTNAYERHLILTLINSTISDVVAKEDVSYDALLGILDRWVTTTVDWAKVAPFSVIGIDEIALTKGHRNFVAVITAQTAHGLHVLAILPDRLKATVSAWLSALPDARKARITTVCTDMWEGYTNAVREALPEATIVIDRFHVARQYRSAVDAIRKTEIRRLKHALPEAQHEQLNGAMWLVRKKPEELDAEERTRLAWILEQSPALNQAYTLQGELTQIFDTARSKADGLRRIGYWRLRVVKSGLCCFDRFLTLLDSWLDPIANYFIDHHTSSFVEGLNNKLKVLKRRCYGVRKVERLFQRLTLDVSGYRWFSPWRT